MGRKPKVREEKKEGPTSLFILTESNPIRRLTVFLIEWPPFEYTVLLTIIANCVVLAIEEPQPNKDKTELAKQLVSTLFRPGKTVHCGGILLLKAFSYEAELAK